MSFQAVARIEHHGPVEVSYYHSEAHVYAKALHDIVAICSDPESECPRKAALKVAMAALDQTNEEEESA